MKFAPALVVNFPPPHQEGSVLGRVVDGESCLEILANITRVMVLDRAIAEVRTELLSLRTHPPQEKLFSFTVAKNVDPSYIFGLFWETLERVQYLNRRIALHQYPEDRIERSGKFYYFLIRLAGIAGGDVAAAKFMDDPRNDCRVRDYLAEHECPNYLIGSFEDELPAKAVRTKRTKDKPDYYRLVEFVPTDSAKKPDYLANTANGRRTISAAELHQMLEQERERLEWLRLNNQPKGQSAPFTNWCPTCKEFVALSHDAPGGIACEEYILQRTKKADQLAAKAAKTLEATCAKEKAKRDRQHQLYMAHIAKTLAPYFGAIRDRAILSSRGTVSAVQIDKLDTKMVRKLSQKKDAQTGRKMGVSKARELWNEVTKENTCQPQHTEFVQYQQELL